MPSAAASATMSTSPARTSPSVPPTWNTTSSRAWTCAPFSAAGWGCYVIKTDTAVLDLFGGGALDKEFFTNSLSRTSGEVQMGDLLNVKLNKTTQITQSLVFSPNVSDGGEYRMNFDTAFVVALKRWLGWHVTISDRYLSNPINAGIKKNDFLVTTGLRITFAR